MYEMVEVSYSNFLFCFILDPYISLSGLGVVHLRDVDTLYYLLTMLLSSLPCL